MMGKIIYTLVFVVAALPLWAGRPYRVADIPNVQVENRYRFVSDPDGLLDAASVAAIDSLCYGLRHRGLAQVAVVAVGDVAGDDLFDFAFRLFSGWGVGRAGSDNGLGILLAVDRREVRFVTGPGLEGVLPDALCKRIQMTRMVPYFREGAYGAGLVAGVRAVASVLEGSELDLGANDDYAGEELPLGRVLLLVFGALTVLLALVTLLYLHSVRCPRCRAYALVQQERRLVSHTEYYDLYEYLYRCRRCGHTLHRRSKSAREDEPGSNHRGGGGMWIGGFGGGRSSGGGFGGGFGGGSFGGGGAGSKW